ncbi:MAG: hypothetical protein ACRBB4_01550 [Neptuniibacter sp.]
MNNHTYNQSEWLKIATPEQTRQFAVAGEPGISSMINTKTGECFYYPTLRDVVDPSVKYTSAEEARQAAEKLKEKLIQETADLPPLDEVALGIEGKCLDQFHVCMDEELRLEKIVHLGCQLARVEDWDRHHLDSAISDWLDDVSTNHRYQHTSTATLRELINKTYLDWNEDSDAIELHGEIFENLLESGMFGFLIQAATPIKKYSSPEYDCCTYSWSYFRTCWVYGETFETAFAAAAEWVELSDSIDKEAYREEASE